VAEPLDVTLTTGVKPGPAERVGSFEFHVKAAEPSAESAERWEQRAECLARWLMDMWNFERRGAEI
jgi:hypothetical protein